MKDTSLYSQFNSFPERYAFLEGYPNDVSLSNCQQFVLKYMCVDLGEYMMGEIELMMCGKLCFLRNQKTKNGRALAKILDSPPTHEEFFDYVCIIGFYFMRGDSISEIVKEMKEMHSCKRESFHLNTDMIKISVQ